MIDEDLERVLKMACVQHQQPVQTFGSYRSHEALRNPVRLRSVHRCPNHTHALRLKHRIEATRELAVPVANQKTNRLLPFTESPRDLPCLLGDPPLVGMGRAAGQMDATAAEFNEEQHVQSLEPHGVDREEIHRDDAACLRSEELSP